MEKITLKIEGMSCQHCADTVKKALNSLNGIGKTEISLEDKNAIIEFDSSKVSIPDIEKSIEGQGYDIIK